MGKTRYELCSFIEDDQSRSIFCSKQKRNILKKAIEISVMCGQQISLTIYDPAKKNFVQYCSTSDFNPKVVSQMLTTDKLRNMSLKMYTNDDYSSIVNGRKGSNENNGDDLKLLNLEETNTAENVSASGKKAYKKGNQKRMMNQLSSLPLQAHEESLNTIQSIGDQIKQSTSSVIAAINQFQQINFEHIQPQLPKLPEMVAVKKAKVNDEDDKWSVSGSVLSNDDELNDPTLLPLRHADEETKVQYIPPSNAQAYEEPEPLQIQEQLSFDQEFEFFEQYEAMAPPLYPITRVNKHAGDSLLRF